MGRLKELEILIEQLFDKIYTKYNYYRDNNTKALINGQKEINVLQKQLNDYIKEYESLK
jgi:capsule polysaccharide export protein KpsC/LpsZ